MPWTENDEREFLKKRSEHFAEEDRQQKEQVRQNELTGGPKCPQCGSYNYIEATKVEICNDCGYEQSYW